MLTSRIQGISLTGLCMAVPNQRLTTEMLYEKFGHDIVDKTVNMVGVKEAHHSVKEQVASDLALVAARKLLLEKKVDLSSIGVLVYVTQTPDYRVPATAVILQHRLGLSKNCAAFDVNLGCSGFVFGLHTAASLLSTINCQRALLLFGDTSSKLADPESRASTILFGDASGALILEKDDHAVTLRFALKTDGSRYPAIIVPGGAFRSRCYSEEELQMRNRSCDFPLMNGTDVFNFSIHDVPELIKAFWAEENETAADYDCVALHQANLFIMKQIARKIGVKGDKLLVCIDRYGNTSSASIPLSLADRYGTAQDGDIRALISGFGVGLSWGVADIRMRSADIFPILYSDEFFPPVEFDEYTYE